MSALSRSRDVVRELVSFTGDRWIQSAHTSIKIKIKMAADRGTTCLTCRSAYSFVLIAISGHMEEMAAQLTVDKNGIVADNLTC